jgi:hypothetical protein
VKDRRRSSRWRKVGTALAAIGVLGAAVGAQGAVAHKVTHDSNLQLKITSIDATTSQYSGKVTSTRSACEAGRPVSVLANGALISSATTLVGGSWSATGATQAKHTTVVATIPRKFLKRNKKHKHKCAPASAQRKTP